MKIRLTPLLILSQAIATAFLACCSCFAEPIITSSDTHKINVGVILPLTGRIASFGTAIRNGFQLGMESLPPDVAAKLSVTFEDDGAQAVNSITAYRRLQSAQRIEVVVSALSNAGNAITPLSENDGVIHIAIATDQTISRGKERTFTIWASSEDLAIKAISETQKRNYKKIALVTTAHEGNIAMRNAILSASTPGIAFPVNEEVLPTELDFSSVISRITRISDLDAIANLLHPAHAGIFAKQAWEKGLKLPQFSLSSFEDKAVRDTAGAALKGQWYVAAQYSEGFVERYKRKYPGASVIGAAHGHDIALLLAELVRNSYDAAQSVQFLKNLQNFHGALSDISANGLNGFKLSLAVKVVGSDGL